MKFLLSLLFSFLVFKLQAQEESFPCKEANSVIKDLFSSGKLERLYVHDCYGPGLHGLSSSYLKPQGEAPKIIEDPNGMDPPEDSEYVAWTCTYSMGNLQDGNISTAWVEGVKGYGINEALVVPCLDLKKPVEIFSGYGKSEGLYQSNSRPKNVRIVIVQAAMEGATQYGTVYKNLRVIKNSEVNLDDKFGFQTLTLPEFTSDKYFDKNFNQDMEYQYFLGIEILEVYEGDKWDDTCISEIRNKN